MILTFTPNPCVDKTVFIGALTPGEKIRSQKCTCIPGGKGNNVSRAVKALGYDTASMVIVGGRPGQHVVDMIEQQDGVRCIPLWVNGMTRTITTVLEEPIHRQTALFEPGSPVTEKEVELIVEIFTQTIIEARVVTFNGGIPDPVLRPMYERLIWIAKEAGVITILDSYGPEFTQGLEAVPYMVKPNQQEAELLVGYPLNTEGARWRAINAFHDKGIPLVVLSLGIEGALVSRDRERFHVIPPEIKEINPVGSGDALVAAFAIGLQENWTLEQMARLGVAAGAANAMSWDIGHFTREEVNHLVAQVQLHHIK